jgi:uncharacterized protein DUF4388
VAGAQEELQEAIADLHDYFSDRKAPLMVADAVVLLLRYPAKLLASQIQAWMAAQALQAPVSDYLYHGAKKIALMGDLNLVPKQALAGYVKGLAEALVVYAPEEERELLKQSLDRLGQAAAAAAASAGPTLLHRQGGAQPPAQSPPSMATEHTLSREVRRLSVLLEHLRPLGATGGQTAQRVELAAQRVELASQFMAQAAVQSTSTKELDEHLAPLRQLGIETGTEQVFRTLAQSLAGWVLPTVEGQALPAVSREQIQAMRQVVSLAEDPAEVAKRYRELVHAAIEQLNEGQLGRATNMFELAERLAAERKVSPAFVEPLRTQGHTALNEDRLRKFAGRTDYRPQLRTVLNFFFPLQPRGLLDALNGEPKRETRHHLLALLEVHEQAARSAAWDLLKASVEPGAEVDPYFQMNLVYLLRVIPRPEGTSIADEVNAVMETAGRSSPPPLVKQVIAYLAQTRDEKAERALMTYLRVFESMLLQPETAVYTPDDVEVLLDRTCAALARYGTPRAWNVLIEHGLKSELRLGSPFLRLAEAGRVDLSSTKDLVDRIIAAVRAELPQGGLLSFTSKRNEDKAASLMLALAGTPLPQVHDLLQEVVSKYPDRRFGEAAAKSLKALANAEKPTAPAGLSGDLDVFGLPNLMTTIDQSKLTGILSLMDAEGRTKATLVFENGMFRGGQCGVVPGEEAVYQLLEQPFPGTFAFVSRADVSAQPRLGAPQELLPLLMDGVRRHDEFKRAAASVPDAARLTATGKPHTSPDDEDPDFGVLVWKQIVSGKTAQECESTIATDSYRVRRLLARWVEEGALN